MDLKKRTLDARAPAEGRAAPLPLPQEGEGRAAPLPTPRPFDGETITLPLPAPGGSEREATGERKPRGIVISKRALDYFMDRYEGHFVRFNNMGAALRRAARDVKERVHRAGDVFDLKPQTPLEGYILSRLKGAAPAEGSDVAARRRDWDEAKRTGDPDVMTRTANAVLRASEGAEGAGGDLGHHTSVQAAEREFQSDALSSSLVPIRGEEARPLSNPVRSADGLLGGQRTLIELTANDDAGEPTIARVRGHSNTKEPLGDDVEQPASRQSVELADRPRLLPNTRPGVFCRGRRCRNARHSLEVDDHIPEDIRRVEREAIAREYGPFTTVDSLKRKREYHQYYLETRITAPGKTCAQVKRQTQIRAVPQMFYRQGPWRNRPVRTDDWTWVWSIPLLPGTNVRVPLPGGYVYHYVDPRTGALVNMTTAGHPLNPGYIIRWVTCERDGTFTVHTLGRGTGYFGIINEGVGPSIFSDLDESVAEDLGGKVISPSEEEF